MVCSHRGLGLFGLVLLLHAAPAGSIVIVVCKEREGAKSVRGEKKKNKLSESLCVCCQTTCECVKQKKKASVLTLLLEAGLGLGLLLNIDAKMDKC